MITAHWMNEPGQQDQLDRIRERGLRWGRATKEPHPHREQRVGEKTIMHAHQHQGRMNRHG